MRQQYGIEWMWGKFSCFSFRRDRQWAKGKYCASENAFPSIIESCTLHSTHNAETNTLAIFMKIFSTYNSKIKPTLKYEPFVTV